MLLSLLVALLCLQVRVTDIIANTYYARVHVARAGGEGEVDVDARPSDAINLAVRFGAPVYIAKKIAGWCDRLLWARACVRVFVDGECLGWSMQGPAVGTSSHAG